MTLGSDTCALCGEPTPSGLVCVVEAYGELTHSSLWPKLCWPCVMLVPLGSMPGFPIAREAFDAWLEQVSRSLRRPHDHGDHDLDP